MLFYIKIFFIGLINFSNIVSEYEENKNIVSKYKYNKNIVSGTGGVAIKIFNEMEIYFGCICDIEIFMHFNYGFFLIFLIKSNFLIRSIQLDYLFDKKFNEIKFIIYYNFLYFSLGICFCIYEYEYRKNEKISRQYKNCIENNLYLVFKLSYFKLLQNRNVLIKGSINYKTSIVSINNKKIIDNEIKSLIENQKKNEEKLKKFKEEKELEINKFIQEKEEKINKFIKEKEVKLKKIKEEEEGKINKFKEKEEGKISKVKEKKEATLKKFIKEEEEIRSLIESQKEKETTLNKFIKEEEERRSLIESQKEKEAIQQKIAQQKLVEKEVKRRSLIEREMEKDAEIILLIEKKDAEIKILKEKNETKEAEIKIFKDEMIKKHTDFEDKRRKSFINKDSVTELHKKLEESEQNINNLNEKNAKLLSFLQMQKENKKLKQMKIF